MFCVFFNFLNKTLIQIFFIRNVSYCENNFFKIEFSQKKIVYFHLKECLVYFSRKHMRKVSWFWLKQNVIIILINSRMMIISDNLDNDEAHHSLGISKTVNLNLNFLGLLQLETFKKMKINEVTLKSFYQLFLCILNSTN